MFSRIVLVMAAVVLAAGCGSGAGEAPPDLVAAFYPLAYAAEQVAGKGVRVRNLTPPGVEPHDLELSPRDVRDVHDAEVVLFVGGGFQPALEDAVAGRSGQSIDVLDGERLLRDESGRVDPHVWLSPTGLGRVVATLGRLLDERPAADALEGRLRRLDGEFRRGLAHCAHRELVTSHAAFGYLADRYGLRQIALTGLAPGVEPSPAALERLVEKVRASGATTVFFESLVSPELAETVAREAGVETAALDPLEGLDGEQLANGADYFSVMRDNLAALRKALDCR